MYHKKLKISSTEPSHQVGVLFDQLYQCLDYGVLATLFALVGDDYQPIVTTTSSHQSLRLFKRKDLDISFMAPFLGRVTTSLI